MAVDLELSGWTELAAGEAEGVLHPAVKTTMPKIAMSERSDRFVWFIRFFMSKKNCKFCLDNLINVEFARKLQVSVSF